MIQAIHLQNVQSIKHLTLPLGKVTVLLGPTDSGKSTVVRALLALFTNSFHKSLLRTGEKSLLVGVVIDNKAVGFSKGDSSFYFIDKEKFIKVGKEIPKEVLALFQLEKIQFDKDIEYFLSIHSQHQSEFLVSEYGGIASKVIGKLSNLGIVYIARRRAISEQKSFSHKKEIALSELDALALALKELKDDSFNIQFLSLQNLLSSADAQNNLLLQSEDLLRAATLFSDFTWLKSSFISLNDSICQLDNLFSNFNIFHTLINSVNESFEILSKFSLLKDEFKKILFEISQVEFELESLSSSISVCPFCNSELTSETKAHLLSCPNA